MFDSLKSIVVKESREKCLPIAKFKNIAKVSMKINKFIFVVQMCCFYFPLSFGNDLKQQKSSPGLF